MNSSLYQVGNNVRIKNNDEINGTLGADNKLDGISFMSQMYQYCGMEFSIIKVVKTFYYKRIITIKQPLYILEDLRCNGELDNFKKRCEKSCYLLWHAKWIEKA